MSGQPKSVITPWDIGHPNLPIFFWRTHDIVRGSCVCRRKETRMVYARVNLSPFAYMGMGQNKATSGPQVVVFGSIYQASILGTHFSPTATW